MYTVVETGGKQYKLAVGDKVRIETLPAKAGEKLVLGRVLFVGGAKGVQVGTPYLDAVKVMAEVVAQGRGKKIKIIRKKRRKGYRKKIGHRQNFTELKVIEIKV